MKRRLTACRNMLRPAASGRGKAGQVAIIMILLAAFGLLFYAASLNFGAVAQKKNSTMIAAEQAAGVMASYMASYAERLSIEYLKGDLIQCKKSSFWSSIWKVIAIVMISVVLGSIIGPMVAPTMSSAVLAGAGTALLITTPLTVPQTIASFRVLAAEAKMIKMWNEMMQKSMDLEDQVLEQGIQTAFRSAVDDPVAVPDFLDMDMDGAFGTFSATDPASKKRVTLPVDEISRPNYFYTWRMKALKPPPFGYFDEFFDRLEDFIYLDDDGDADPKTLMDFGLHDPREAGCFNGAGPAECDPCCVPAPQPCCEDDSCTTAAEERTCYASRPTECPDINSDNGYAAVSPGGESNKLSCGQRSYLGASYPWVYQPYFEETSNNPAGYVSFREGLGRDDEVDIFTVQSANPNWHTDPQTDTQVPRAVTDVNGDGDKTDLADRFIQQDATGYYDNDNQEGIFPFFHKINLGIEAESPQSMQRLPDDFSTGTTLDQLIIPDGTCALQSGSRQTGWKPGSDRICSSTFPYDTECSKHGTCTMRVDPTTEEGGEGAAQTEDRDCRCGEGRTDPADFPEDMLDEMYWGITEFLEWAETIINLYKRNGGVVGAQFDDWYRELAEWMEDADSCGSSPCANVTGEDRLGKLRVWREEMWEVYWRVRQWKEQESSVATSCPDAGVSSSYLVWCTPYNEVVSDNEYGITECPGVTPEEAATFDLDGDDERGELEEVIACLDWNLNDPVRSYDGTVLGAGNEDKFSECHTLCESQSKGMSVDMAELYYLCTRLPRSVSQWELNSSGRPRPNYPDYPIEQPQEWSDGDVDQDVLDCFLARSLGECRAECPAADPFLAASFDDPHIDAETKIAHIDNVVVPGCAADSTQQYNGVCDVSAGFTNIDCDSPQGMTLEDDIDDCKQSWAGSCAEFPFFDPRPANRPFYDDVTAAIPTNGVSPSCESPGTDLLLWLEDTLESFDAGGGNGGQKDYFIERKAELEELRDRMDNLLDVLGEAIDRFSEFLDGSTAFSTGPDADSTAANLQSLVPDGDYDDGPPPDWGGSGRYLETRPREIDLNPSQDVNGNDDPGHPHGAKMVGDVGSLQSVYQATGTDSPAEMIIKHYQNREEESNPLNSTSKLPSVLVYAWNTVGRDGGPLGHAVKIEVRAPKRCNAACSYDGTSSKRYPWLRTYSTGGFFSKKVCTVLEDYTGMVKARVIRYDQPADTSKFSFANKVPFTGRNTAHPDAGRGGGNFVKTCSRFMDQTLVAVPNYDPANLYMDEAIMLNYAPASPGSSNNGAHIAAGDMPAYAQCWKHIHEDYLQYGMHSESCAQYYWGNTGLTSRTRPAGMQIRFGKCDAGFLSGGI
ncbi:MAG: hypothetical protein ACLFPX_07125 [Candidatus Omnitrophota bacterium]